MDAINDSIVLRDGLPKILPPYEDGIFRAILTLPEAREALRSAVTAFIGRPVKSVTLRNNAAPSRDTGAKDERYDINCVADGEDGDQCNVEMQATQMRGDNTGNEHINVRWRCVFNLCDLHSNQEGRGRAYGEFARSYQITLCKYKVFKEDQCHVERFTFRNTDGRELCDAVTAIIIDLSQAEKIAKKPVGEMTLIEQWTVFFALGNVPAYSGIIAEMTRLEEGIAVAKDTLTSISQNPDERARFHSRRMWLLDREHDNAVMASIQAELAEKDAELADKDAIIAELKAQLNKS